MKTTRPIGGSAIPGFLVFLAALSVLSMSPPALAQAGAEVEAATQTEVPLPYRGSLAFYEHSTRPWGFADEELTYNPQYVHSLTLRPRWYFNENVWARIDFAIEQELTNADDTTYQNEWRIPGATTLDVNYTGLLARGNLSLNAGLTLGFPTDKISQLRTMYLSVAPKASAVYALPTVLSGLSLTFAVDFAKYLNRYADGDSDVTQYCTGSRGQTEACTSTGSMNPNFRLLWGLSGELTVIPDLVVSANFRIYDFWAYATPDAAISTLSGDVGVPHSGDDTRLRASNRFTFDVSYNFTKYFGISVGTDTYVPQLADDATYRNPFFNRFTLFYLDLNVMPDELVRVLNPSMTAATPARTAEQDGVARN